MEIRDFAHVPQLHTEPGKNEVSKHHPHHTRGCEMQSRPVAKSGGAGIKPLPCTLLTLEEPKPQEAPEQKGKGLYGRELDFSDRCFKVVTPKQHERRNESEE